MDNNFECSYLIPSTILEDVLDFVVCQKQSCLKSVLCLFQPPALKLKYKSHLKWSGKIPQGP